jgi:predicted SprT family Zn-dependent metalloprotease
MDTTRAEMMAKDLIKYHLADMYRFTWDNAKRRRGCCNYRKGTISLSYPLTQIIPEDNIINTILHEIAHALAPAWDGHGPAWRKIALALGCDGKRCASDKVSLPAPWVAICAAGHLYKKYRKPRSGSLYSCGKCSPRFDFRFLLTYQRSKEVSPSQLLAAESGN